MTTKKDIVLIVGILLLFLISNASAAASPPPPPANTCTLGGQYTSKWININIIVILIGFIVVGFAYAIGKLLPRATGQKVAGISKVEISQLILSLVIIGVLLSLSTAACNISSNLGNSLLKTSGLNPFQYSEYYVENLSMNTGMGLLSYIYTTGISYAIYSAMINSISESFAKKPQIKRSFFSFSISSIGTLLKILLETMSNLYLELFSTILLTMIGMLFVQWLSLPIIEAIAFTLMLPFALILRSLSFTSSKGQGLKEVANTILAIAIALYLIYPLMIMFNSYAISYVFSPSNPLYSCKNCLGSALSPIKLQSSYFNGVESQTSKVGILGFMSPPISSFINGPLLSNLGLLDPGNVFLQIQHVISGISRFIFMGLFLFGIDLTVTIGFAISLTKALNLGLEGDIPFWDSL